jgi:hypothetical protein
MIREPSPSVAIPTATAPWLAAAARLVTCFLRFDTLRVAVALFGGKGRPGALARSLSWSRIVLPVACSNGQRLLYLEGERFIHERHLLRSLQAPGVVTDVGASIGYYLLPFERTVGHGAYNTCFEPDPTNLRTAVVKIHPELLAPPAAADSVLGRLARAYPRPLIYERNPERSVSASLAARYLNRAVRQVGDVPALLGACRNGSRREPWGAVCRASACAF